MNEHAIEELCAAITRAKDAGLSREQIHSEVDYIFDTPEEE